MTIQQLKSEEGGDTLRATYRPADTDAASYGLPVLQRSKSNLRGSIRSFFSKISHKKKSKESSEDTEFLTLNNNIRRSEFSSFHLAGRRASSFSSVKSRSSDIQGRPPRHSQASQILGQGLASLKSSSFKKLYGNHSRIQLLDETWEDWLEKYQRGDVNLSKLERPTCFNGFGHMAPPLYKFETTRLRAVEKVKDGSLWKPELYWLVPELSSILYQHRLKSATVSVVEQNVQQIVWQTGIGQHFRSVSRDLSLDAHTLLSKGYFALLDCSNDWRTRLNPLVHGPPFIKFYFGVNIMFDKVPIGCIAVCDPYLKTQAAPVLIEQLNQLSIRLSQALELSFYQRPSVNPRIQWNDERVLTVIDNSESEDAGISRESETVSLLSQATQYSPERSNSSLNLSSIESNGVNSHIGLSEFSATLQPITCKSALQPFEVFESLLRCLTVPQAIKKACKIIQHNLGADVTYLAECRVKQGASAKLAHQYQDIPSSSTTEPTSQHSSDAKVKLVGNCTPQMPVDINSLVSSQTQLIVSAIYSRYGIQFMNGHSSQDTLWSGMVMPLRRQEMLATGESPAVAQQWTGGFVMAVFYIGTQRKFSPGDQLFMKKVVRALENILTCFDELRPVQ